MLSICRTGSSAGPAQVKIRAAHLAGQDIGFRFFRRLPRFIFCASDFSVADISITSSLNYLRLSAALMRLPFPPASW